MTYAADFETTGKLNLQTDGRVRVWLWSLVNCETKEEYWGTELSEFVDLILQLKPDKIYFHNLRFDGSFLLYWMVENNWLYGIDYTCMIDEMNIWYEIKILNGETITKIWDSLKKF